jgi:hypothetical protein
MHWIHTQYIRIHTNTYNCPFEETFRITACTLHLMLSSCHWPASHWQSVSLSIIGPGGADPGPAPAPAPDRREMAGRRRAAPARRRPSAGRGPGFWAGPGHPLVARIVPGRAGPRCPISAAPARRWRRHPGSLRRRS